MYHEAFTVITQPKSSLILPLVHIPTGTLLLASVKRVGRTESGGVAGTSAPVTLAACGDVSNQMKLVLCSLKTMLLNTTRVVGFMSSIQMIASPAVT